MSLAVTRCRAFRAIKSIHISNATCRRALSARAIWEIALERSRRTFTGICGIAVIGACSLNIGFLIDGGLHSESIGLTSARDHFLMAHEVAPDLEIRSRQRVAPCSVEDDARRELQPTARRQPRALGATASNPIARRVSLLFPANFAPEQHLRSASAVGAASVGQIHLCRRRAAHERLDREHDYDERAPGERDDHAAVDDAAPRLRRDAQ